ncbi:MAG: TMEM43 family protein [Luteimonas sp.]
MRQAAWLAALLAIAGSTFAQDEPAGAPQPDRTVRDLEFGVVARHVGLERRVEMLQWQAVPNGYAKVWSVQPIDSSGFAYGHENPGALPLRSRRWLAQTISIDDEPLDAEVVARLGEWRDFRPGFSGLPGNLAATFQPEGDGLGSAENPLDPQIGDLRIRWRELVLPPLQGRITLQGGRWRLLAEQRAAAPDGKAVDPAHVPSEPHRAPWLFGGAMVVLIAAFAARRRRRNR